MGTNRGDDRIQDSSRKGGACRGSAQPLSESAIPKSSDDHVLMLRKALPQLEPQLPARDSLLTEVHPSSAAEAVHSSQRE